MNLFSERHLLPFSLSLFLSFSLSFFIFSRWPPGARRKKGTHWCPFHSRVSTLSLAVAYRMRNSSKLVNVTNLNDKKRISMHRYENNKIDVFSCCARPLSKQHDHTLAKTNDWIPFSDSLDTVFLSRFLNFRFIGRSKEEAYNFQNVPRCKNLQGRGGI